jgi:hypothetical protein
MPLNCAICSATVARKDSHRNRYREIICRPCALAGARFTWRNRLRYQLGKVAIWVWIPVGAAALVLLLLWLAELMVMLEPVKLLE